MPEIDGTLGGKIVGKGITFDDVLAIPAKSEVLPGDIDLKTRATKRYGMNIPIFSAAMDTVTEDRLCTGLGREGGIGVHWKDPDEKNQANGVAKVKRARSGIIDDPYTLRADATVGEARKIGHSVIVVDDNNKVLGIVTKRDLVGGVDLGAKLREVMTPGKSNPHKKLVTAYRDDIQHNGELDVDKIQDILRQDRVEKLILVDKHYRLDGLITQKDLNDLKDYPNQVVDSQGRLLCAAAIGPKDYSRLDLLIAAGVDIVVIDTAHGHSQNVIDTVVYINKHYKGRTFDMVAGNIATYEAAIALLEAGVDGVKTGVGPGSTCTTRIIAGIGMPQLTAIAEVRKGIDDYVKAHGGIRPPQIADGGIRYSGDIVKAIIAGADSVMLGSLLAGVDESPGEELINPKTGEPMKYYRGMGSEGARKAAGDKDRYLSSKTVAEGVEGGVPLRGPLSEWIKVITGGVKSGFGYCGCRTIPELQERGRFIEITAAGLERSHPHGITITKAAKNYPLK